MTPVIQRKRGVVLRRTRLTVVGLIAALAAAAIVATPADAAVPDAPTLVSPAAGATTPSTDVVLSATASDPDGGALDVRFEGRKVGATVPTGAGEPFTIGVLPDTQNYSDGRQAILRAQTQWYVDNRDALDLAFVAQLGDLVGTFDIPRQWNNVSTAFQPLDAAHVPYTVVPGNHDFDNATGEFALYDQYFPTTRFSGNTWTPATARYGGYLGQNLFGPDPIDRKNMDNFALFTAGGTDFLVLNLEWEAPGYALDWGRKVLAAYPDRTAILVTHAFLDVNGNRRTTIQRPGGTAPAALWSQFVSQQCSIRLVLAGHEHDGDLGEARRTDLNTCGQPVPQILSDYQSRANGGDGWLRYYTFDPAAGTMRATTYSPTLGRYETDDSSAFTLPFALSPQQPAPFAPIATVAGTSGGTVSATWRGLEPDTAYEWRVVGSDGSGTATSQTRTFRTPPAAAPAVDDTFSRTTTNGWNVTDTGQGWTQTGSASGWTVSGGKGRVAMAPGVTRTSTLAGLSATDVTVTTDFATSVAPAGTGTYAAVVARSIGNNSYRVRARFTATGGVQLLTTRVVSGAETTLSTYTVPGLTVAPGQAVKVRLEAQGTSPTTLRARAWLVGAAEPATWPVTLTDSTPALQAAGSAGVSVYLSSAAPAASVSLDRFTVEPIGGPQPPPPVNTPPTASIAAPSVDGLTVGLSGAGSTDTDGTVVGWAWDFGDGTAGSGSTTSHAYAQAGTYVVRLTVTDDDGATASITRSVTVTAPPTPPTGALASDTFTRTSSSGWGVADVGGPWSVGGTAARYTVADGTARLGNVTAGTTLEASLGGVGSSATELRGDLTWSRSSTAGTLYTSLVARRFDARNGYQTKIVVGSNNRPQLQLVRKVNNVDTTVSSVALPLTQVVGTAYTVATQAVTIGGSTTLRAKLWPTGTAEPAWQVTGTDTTAALQGAGGVGLSSYLSSGATAPIVTSVDNLRVTAVTP